MIEVRVIECERQLVVSKYVICESLTREQRFLIKLCPHPSSEQLRATFRSLNMSERTPLLSGSVNGPSTTSLPSRRDVQNSMPSKNQRIKAAQALGAVQAGKLPYVFE